MLIPGCDGDVSEFAGVGPYARMLKGTGAAPRSVVIAWGGNHNFFNTEWQTSDSQTCRGSQKAMFEAADFRKFTTAAAPKAGCDAACWAKFQAEQAIPFGVRGSAKQTDLARILMTAFFKAHVGTDRDPSFANVFDPKFDIPERLDQITALWRDYASPNAGEGWPTGAILKKVSDTSGVEVKPIDKLLAEAAQDAIAKLKPTMPKETVFQPQAPQLKDAVAIEWSASAPGRASIALPPAKSPVSYVQLVISSMPQTIPCLVPKADATCAGDAASTDFAVRFTSEYGESTVHRLTEFGPLVPYLRSNIINAKLTPAADGKPPVCVLRMNEPVFDTIVIPVEGFTIDGKPFQFTSSSRVRFDFDPGSEGTISVRNVRLLGPIAQPQLAATH
jgi:hypothetical protein